VVLAAVRPPPAPRSPWREGRGAAVELPSGTPRFAGERGGDPRGARAGRARGPDALVELRVVDLLLPRRRPGNHDGDLSAQPLDTADALREVTERAAQQLLVLLGELASDGRFPIAH